MRGLEFGAVIVCDDIRKEVTGKEILIGVYTGEILVSSFPSWFPAALWIEIETLEIGRYDVTLRFSLTDKPPILMKAGIEVSRSGTIAIACPGLQLHAEKECEFILEVQDGEEWKVLKRKKIMQGNVNLAFPTLAGPLPTNT
jgi:hypothetical protein